jgi:hypothetical protein
VNKHLVRRYGVDAVFADGSHITLRDFRLAQNAVNFALTLKDRDLYPGRVYRIEIVPFDVDPEDASYFD